MKTCTKKAYKNRKSAMRAVSLARSKGFRYYSYKCPYCKKFHLATGDHQMSRKAYLERKRLKETMTKDRGIEWLDKRLRPSRD